MIRAARAGGVLALLTLGTITLTGCVGATEPDPTRSPSSTPNASGNPFGTPGPGTIAPTGGASDDEAAPDPNAATAASRAAFDALTAYCRPTLPKSQWIAELSPLLTARGVTAYETVDPAVVPCTAVTGEPAVRDGDDSFTFRINVPTDAGMYEVYVTRSYTTDPWLAERMSPAE
ncbi:hypothetical protein KXS11_17995 [Plantibacter flavus]|uniref:hypothetical protein n=1 Tax=Plantibacter flavus TaxID=150123 RepID=UPI003F135F5F